MITMLDQVSLVEEIRGLLGNPLEAEVSSTTINSAINSALSEYSRLRPVVKLLQLQLLTDIGEYDLPMQVCGVVDCTFALSGGVECVDYTEYLFKAFEDDKNDMYKYTELTFLNGDGVTKQKLIVRPVPKTDFLADIRVSLKRELKDVPPLQEEIFKLYVLAKSQEALAGFREKISAAPTSAGYKMTLNDGVDLRKAAKENFRKFYTALGATAVVS